MRHNGLVSTVAEIVIQRPAGSGAAAQTVDPLTLELTSSRELCTANTLTELSWVITGGIPPYTLTIDGETVEANAESHRANCGPIPTDPFTNDPLPNPTKSFSATVTDSQTTPDSATDDVRVELVPPLPAPQNVQYASYVADVPVRWDPVPGAGAQSPRSIHPDSGTDWQITGVVRTRLLDDRVWSYDVAGFAQGRKTLAPLAGLRVPSVAAVRHPLEVDTPEALNWSAELTYAATTEAQNVVLTVTHDTLTASWDKQPYARDQGIHAILELEATGGERRLQLWEEEGVSGRHEVTIGDLPPETDFTFAIVMVDTSATSGNPFRRAVRTKPAPPGWIPLPTGAQNLRVTSSDDGHTISWDPPSPHSARSWALRVDNVATGRNVFHTFTSGATTWTISRDRLFSSARYRVTVVHFDLDRIEASIEFNTTQSPPVGQIVDPLTLELVSSRELCTAGTLTELSWTIAGGRPPYTLTIDGETVDAAAESHRANCGPIPADPMGPLPGTTPAKTFRASVTDSQATPVTATAEVQVELAPPLPAPTNLWLSGLTQEVIYGFDYSVAGAGAQAPEDAGPYERLWQTGYVLRVRATSASAAEPYDIVRVPQFTHVLEWTVPGPHHGMVASMRHPIERHTPSALIWSAPVSFALAETPQNVTVTATHDTVTVSWDEQPHADCNNLSIDGPGYHNDAHAWDLSTSCGRHTYTFERMPPETEFDIHISIGCYADEPEGTSYYTPNAYAFTGARTKAAPSDWTPPPVGPLNLRATATHDEITLTWDRPHPDARPAWRVLVYEGERYFATLAGHSERPVRIRFGMRSYVRPSTTYRVLVTHHGATTGSAEVTVTTAAAPAEGVAPTSYERLIPPGGTTYTFTPSTDPAAADLITFDLHAARPWPFQRPGLKPELGDVIVRDHVRDPAPATNSGADQLARPLHGQHPDRN